MQPNNIPNKELVEQYKILSESYISNELDGFKILNFLNNNFTTLLKKKDYYAHLNYVNLVKFYIYSFLYHYKGKSDTLKEIIKLLNKDNRNKKLDVINSIFNDKFLYKNIIKKYYPFDDEFNLNSNNLNLLNHIYIHKEKIFNEENIIKLVRKYYKELTLPDDDDTIKIINTGIIKGFTATPATIQDRNYGINCWINSDKGSIYAVKCIYLSDNSEYNLVNRNGVIKLLLSETVSDINNYQEGVNTIRYKYIILLNKKDKNIIFISTAHINDIANRKLDKQVSIQFDNKVIYDKEVLKKYIKLYKFN